MTYPHRVKILGPVFVWGISIQVIEDLADQPHLPADEHQLIEKYHQLIQQHKRLICDIIGCRSLPKYQQGVQCLVVAILGLKIYNSTPLNRLNRNLCCGQPFWHVNYHLFLGIYALQLLTSKPWIASAVGLEAQPKPFTSWCRNRVYHQSQWACSTRHWSLNDALKRKFWKDWLWT